MTKATVDDAFENANISEGILKRFEPKEEEIKTVFSRNEDHNTAADNNLSSKKSVS